MMYWVNEATMTNTPMSEREKELVESAREYLRRKDEDWESHDALRLRESLRAYDPKPEREYTMPEWTKFMVTKGVGSVGNANGDQFALFNNHMIRPDVYNAIREALSKPKAPTE